MDVQLKKFMDIDTTDMDMDIEIDMNMNILKRKFFILDIKLLRFWKKDF